jgi:hypothetical protein
MASVLVCGVYLSDRPNLALSSIEELAASAHHRVTQRWIALDPRGTGVCNLPFTVATIGQATPKFTLINRLIDRSVYPIVLPFDRRSPTGWGLDFVWPVLMESNGLRMGIVDATPVSYSRLTLEQLA